MVECLGHNVAQDFYHCMMNYVTSLFFYFFVKQKDLNLLICSFILIFLQLYGRVIAPDGPNNWKERDLSTWLRFKDIAWLTVSGSGLMDGRGKGWWDASCRYRHGKADWTGGS